MSLNANCSDDYTTTQIVVGSGGVLTASGTAINSAVDYGGTSQIAVNNGAILSADHTSFAANSMTLSSGSTDTVQYDSFASQITIDSGAAITFAQNDLSAATVVATGVPSATIDLTNNYWGTTDPVQIQAKITDHTTNSNLPTVLFNPPLSLQPAQTAAAPANTTYYVAAHAVTLSATVTSPSGIINAGTEKFTILKGSTVIGSAVTVSVSSGAASASYTLPAGTAIGTYTIKADFSGTSIYNGCTDSSQLLTVAIPSTVTAAANASVTFAAAAQGASLSATVASAGGTVNQGQVKFTILSGGSTVGSPITVNVSSGNAAGTYPLPAGIAGGTYTIDADYIGTVNFTGSSDSSHSLTVGTASTTTAASNASVTFDSGNQNVTLSAAVTSSAGTVSEGTVTFTLLDSSNNTVATYSNISVSGGSASTSAALPTGLAGGTYTIQADYIGTENYANSTDSSHTLTVNPAGTTTTAGDLTATYSTATQALGFSATVTSSAGTVGEGGVTFTVLDSNNNTVASYGPFSVSSGSASSSCTLPGGVAPGTYTIQADYTGAGSYANSADSSHTLTVNAAPSATVSVTLDSGSDSGAPDYPGYTNDTTPTFDVQVNQAGKITMDFDGDSALDQTLTVTAAGTYQFTAPSLSDDPYTATASFDAGLAGTPQSQAAYTIDTATPSVTAMSPTGTLDNSISQATVTFSEVVDLSTFKPAGITFTAPSGTISVNQPQWVSGTTYSISFATQTATGTYSLDIAAGLTDWAGNAMTSDFNGSFTTALPDLAMTATSAPPSAIEGTSIAVSWQVTNNGPVAADADAWHDAVYVSTKSTFDNTAVLLTSVAGPATALAAHTSYSRSPSVTLPSDLAVGNYYLLFVANANGGQYESDHGDDTNDVIADPIALSAADLQVSGISGPATGDTGQAVLFNWTDTNNGTATAVGPWVDNVYVAKDAQGHNPTLMGSFTFNGQLAVGASAQLTEQVILPQTAGTLWFMVTTNATQTVAEGADYGNDTTVASSSVSVTAVPLPDLVVSSITPPANGVFSGTSVPVSFVVTNQGQAATSAPVWQDWVILSQDATLASTYQGQLNATGPGGDQTLTSQPDVLGFDNPSYLGVGQSYQQNVNVPLPIDAQGTWYVYVVPDGTGAHHPFAMPEASRTDKLALSAGFSVTLSPPPALVVSAVTAPANDFSGKPMTLSWTVKNNGTGPTAADAWTDAVYMSTKSTLDAKPPSSSPRLPIRERWPSAPATRAAKP